MPDPIKSLTIDELYEAYMDLGDWGAEGQYGSQEFAYDVYDWFKGDVTGKSKSEWATEYGMYLPSYDPTAANLAAQERELSYRNAENVYDLAKDISNQVYSTAVGDVSSSLATDIGKGKFVAGKLGLRSGGLESAISEAKGSAQNKTRGLGESLQLKKTENQNTYNNAMVDATLDYDKDLHQTKSEFYDRTLAMINKLTDIGAFDEAPPPICSCVGGQPSTAIGEFGCTYEDCPEDACGTVNGSVTDPLDCTGGTPNTVIDGSTITGDCEYGSCDFTDGCQQVCVAAGASEYGPLMTCVQDCTGAMGGGAGTWGADTWVIDTIQDMETAANCPGGGQLESTGYGFEYVCFSGGDTGVTDECYNEKGEYICGDTSGCVDSYCCTSSCQPKFPGCQC